MNMLSITPNAKWAVQVSSDTTYHEGRSTSGLKIQSVTATILDLPLKRVQKFAAISADTTAIVLIEIQTDHGPTGYGEATLPSGPWWGGESVESIKSIIEIYLAPHMIGCDPFNVTGIFRRLNRKVYGNPFAKASLEMALLDIQGRFCGLPLHDLLGGQQRGALECSWPLASGDAAQEIDEAERMIAAGKFRNFKFKMGFLDPEADIERAEKVYKALEGRASLRADPNEMWSEITCKHAIPRLVEAGIDILEQPIDRKNLEGLARLTQYSPIPIMADESLCSESDMACMDQLHAADLISLKIMKSGGMLATRRIVDRARLAGIGLYMGTFLEGGLGTAANMQLAATLPDLPFGGELSGAELIAEDITVEQISYKDFALQVPEGPGLGVTIDMNKVNHFAR